MVSLRVCRHCRKPVSLEATSCNHCHRKLMPPARYKKVLAVMAGILVIAYAYLAYAIIVFFQAKALA